jgi:hypothetical protein
MSRPVAEVGGNGFGQGAAVFFQQVQQGIECRDPLAVGRRALLRGDRALQGEDPFRLVRDRLQRNRRIR